MIGAIIGDIVGSRFEFNNCLSTEFELFGRGCGYTDDSIMTVAVADAIMSKKPFGGTMREYGRQYPYPMGGYGGRFGMWLRSESPRPYDSFGNGSAMRVSPCAFLAKGDREKALSLAAQSAMPTHNHPEGIKGAMAVTDAILMAFGGASKEEMSSMISGLYQYDLSDTCDNIRAHNTFSETCMVTAPQAIVCFLESSDFESAIRLAVSIGGDSDTIAAITGGIAEAFYGVPDDIRTCALEMLPQQLRSVIDKMYAI